MTGEDDRRFARCRARARRWIVSNYGTLSFWNPFIAQMTGIYKNNGILRVILSFAKERRFRSKKPFSQPTSQSVSQLRKECHCAAKWHSCAKNRFRNCETPCGMELWLRKQGFSRFIASQPFHNCELGVPVLRSSARVPKSVSQLWKFS